jgi:hypothetical protein
MSLTPGLDFDRTGLTEIPVSADATPAVARYFYLIKEDDFVTDFCVAGAVGPNSVETLAPDGSFQRWPSFWRDGLLMFRAPDGYAGGQGLCWSYDRRLQRGEPMPRPDLERRALGMRVSVSIPSRAEV